MNQDVVNKLAHAALLMMLFMELEMLETHLLEELET
jgi:hypothetical protein